MDRRTGRRVGPVGVAVGMKLRVGGGVGDGRVRGAIGRWGRDEGIRRGSGAATIPLGVLRAAGKSPPSMTSAEAESSPRRRPESARGVMGPAAPASRALCTRGAARRPRARCAEGPSRNTYLKKVGALSGARSPWAARLRLRRSTPCRSTRTAARSTTRRGERSPSARESMRPAFPSSANIRRSKPTPKTAPAVVRAPRSARAVDRLR